MGAIVICLGFSACATIEDEELGMIPPSANYSPIQAPVYPPLNQPYSPNLLNGDDSRVMNIDRLNVGEANIPALQGAQNGANGAQNGNANAGSDSVAIAGIATNGAPDSRDYTSDYANEYVPGYIAPSEVVPYEEVLPSPEVGVKSVEVPTFPPLEPRYEPRFEPRYEPQYEPRFEPTPAPETPTPAPAIAEPKVEPEPKVPNIIPNSPYLESENVIELSAVGMGVAPESTISPSQALALAKRAAIIDAYRQIGEKMYGIKINAQDTVKDMVMTNSVVKARVEALIKNADIVETIYKDGLCQVTMELKLDSRTWNRILATNG